MLATRRLDPQIPLGMASRGSAYLLAIGPLRRVDPEDVATRSANGAGGGRLRRVAVVLMALAGPVERWAEEIFWVHMVQHLLRSPSASSVRAGRNMDPAARLLRPGARRRMVAWWRGGRSTRPLRVGAAFLAVPAAAWIAFNVNLVVWHIPAAFDLTLLSEPVHDLEHVLFLALGVLFWSQVIDSPPLRLRLGHLQRAIYVGAAAVVGWALSIALNWLRRRRPMESSRPVRAVCRRSRISVSRPA